MFKSTIASLLSLLLSPFRWLIRVEMHHHLQNISGELQRRSLDETATYVDEHLHQVDSVNSPFKLLTVGLNQVTLPNGLYLEFGVFSGNTINHVAKRIEGTIYGFDSFEGLPERWRDRMGAGTFKRKALPAVRPNVQLIKGWFDQTLPDFLKAHPGDISFLHVDCDLYSSTKTIFSCLQPRIKAGTIIVFDEYFNYPGWKGGEFKAFQEFLAQESWGYEYLGYNRHGEQVCVKITGQKP